MIKIKILFLIEMLFKMKQQDINKMIKKTNLYKIEINKYN